MLDRGVSRRAVLRTLGAGVAASGLAGIGSAAEEPTRFIIGTRPDGDVSTAEVRARSVHRRLDFADRGTAVVGEFDPEDAATLQERDDVRYVERDVEVKALGERLPWGIERVDAERVHEEGFSGAGAHIAVIDTGIDSDHPDLAPNLGEGYAVVPCEDDDCDEPWDDDHDHGTHVAGIADAVDNKRGVVGVNTAATLHAVKALSGDGRGSSSSIAEGIKWVADQGYDIVNLSLGADSSSEVMRDAVQYASDRGVLLVAAAGNDGPCSDCVGYPAAYSEVVAVSSTAPDDDLSEFSSTGPEVEIAAPGTEVLSTVIGGYDSFSGTSMATPHVAGAAGQLFASDYSAAETRARLSETAENVGLDDEESGYGLLDVQAAVAGESPADGLAVRTGRPTDVAMQAATVTGQLVGLGDASEATVSFAFWQAGAREKTERTVGETALSATGSFEATVDGLDAETEYRYFARAENGTSTATGQAVGFTTGSPRDAPTVETLAPTDIEEDEAELQGHLRSLGDASEVVPGFRYWEKGAKEGTETAVETWDMDEPGEFDEDTEDLQPGTTYVAVAVAVTEDGRQVAGEPIEFVSGGGGSGDPEGIELATLNPEDVESDAATLRGELRALGGYEEVTPGFTYWVRDRKDETRETVEAWDEDEPATFDEDVDDLGSGETYAVVATAATPDGQQVAGDPIEFVPGGDDGDDGDEKPDSVQVRTGTSDDIEDDEATLAGELTATGGHSEVETAFTYWIEGDTSTSATAYAGDRESSGDFADRVVRLDPDTTYVYRAEAWPEGTPGERVTGETQTFTTGSD